MRVHMETCDRSEMHRSNRINKQARTRTARAPDQADEQTERHEHRRTDGRRDGRTATDRLADVRANRQVNRPTGRWADARTRARAHGDETDRQTDRQTDGRTDGRTDMHGRKQMNEDARRRQGSGQTDAQAGRHIDKQTDRQADRRTDRQTDRQTNTCRRIDRRAGIQTGRQTIGWTDRRTGGRTKERMERGTDRRTDGGTNRPTDGHSDRQPDRWTDGRTDGRTGRRMDRLARLGDDWLNVRGRCTVWPLLANMVHAIGLCVHATGATQQWTRRVQRKEQRQMRQRRRYQHVRAAGMYRHHRQSGSIMWTCDVSGPTRRRGCRRGRREQRQQVEQAAGVYERREAAHVLRSMRLLTRLTAVCAALLTLAAAAAAEVTVSTAHETAGAMTSAAHKCVWWATLGWALTHILRALHAVGQAVAASQRMARAVYAHVHTVACSRARTMRRWVSGALVVAVLAASASEHDATETVIQAGMWSVTRLGQAARQTATAACALQANTSDDRDKRTKRAHTRQRQARRAAIHAAVWQHVGTRRPAALPFLKRRMGTRGKWRMTSATALLTLAAAIALRLNAEIAATMHATLLLCAGDVEPHPGPANDVAAASKNTAILGKRAQRRAARGKGGVIRVGTLNAPGIHVRRTDRTGTEQDEGWGDGWDLKTAATPKLAAVRDMMQQKLLTITTLTETRLRMEEMDAVGGYFRRVGYQHAGLPGYDSDTGHAVWGVSVVWDQGRMRLVDAPVEVVPHRVIRVTLEVVGDKRGTRMTVYGTYMPQRSNDVQVQAAWQALEEDALGRSHVWIAGDMNAEMPEVRESRRLPSVKRAVAQSADLYLLQILHTVNLQYTGTGEPTHHKGTEIDHVLVNMRQASSTSKAKIVPGVSGKDHKLVWVEHFFEIDAEGCGPARVIGTRLDKVTTKEWGRF